MKKILLGLGIVVLLGVLFVHFFSKDVNLDPQTLNSEIADFDDSDTASTRTDSFTERELTISENLKLPLSGSTPVENVKHTIPIDEIRQGCFRQDCIPSIDDPEFIDVTQAGKLLQAESIGIALSYKEVDRFYPFPMLETHELVNDIVAGDPLLVSYCPLCGTGIVFSRALNGETVEFGVSGMLWQSNLLMYNRAEFIGDRNLWSQVLGEAVVGNSAGEKLVVISSDIMKFSEWSVTYPDGEVLAGIPRDPYGGNYYGVAQNFKPNFDNTSSGLTPDAYVYGIVVDGVYKAYPKDQLPIGTTEDVVGNVTLTILNADGHVQFLDGDQSQIADIEGFWFSWKAAHPNTLLWK